MWSIEIAGHPDAVVEAIKRRKIVGDQSQFEMILAFVEHELSFHTMSRESGVSVKATGHHGPDGRSLSITIAPIPLALDKELCLVGNSSVSVDTKNGKKPIGVT